MVVCVSGFQHFSQTMRRQGDAVKVSIVREDGGGDFGEIGVLAGADANGLSVLQRVHVLGGRSGNQTGEKGLVDCLGDALSRLFLDSRPQGALVADELFGNRDDLGDLERLHDARTDGRIVDWLLVCLSNPFCGRHFAKSIVFHAGTGQFHSGCELCDGGLFKNTSPNLIGLFRRQVDAGGGTAQIERGHGFLLKG